MWRLEIYAALLIATTLAAAAPAPGQEGQEPPTTAERHDHRESAREHDGPAPPEVETPPLPEGMTLDEVLDRAASEPPADFPEPVPDDRIYAFTLFDQLEYRFADDRSPDHLGWEAQGWVGGDLHKFWWKNEGEAVFDGPDEGESETDLLYSRLITPFWSAQVGVQYANEWVDDGPADSGGDSYEDRWSGVIALQGLAPYKFEVDGSLYVSEEADVTLEVEAEYDLRITQRLVLQPRAEVGLAAQDVPERGLGSGLTGADLDLRLRYEIRRELAPYVGVRHSFLVGETEDLAEAAGEDPEHWFLLGGVRFAF